MNPSISNLLPQPLPGEIWAVNASADFDAQTTLRYLIIIREPQAAAPELVTVMVLSTEIRFASNVNILIPPAISGLSIDTLAQTTNIGEIAIDYLQHQVGHRLTRQIYDLLLATGNPQSALTIDRPLPSTSPVSRAADDRFALHERAWLIALNPNKIARIDRIVAAAIAVDRQSIDLSQWWQHLFTDDWQELKPFDRPQPIATRRANSPDRIEDTLSKLESSNDDDLACQLIRQLNRQIRAERCDFTSVKTEIERVVIKIIDRTDDDELFWMAIDCLQAIDPAHSRASIGRTKSIGSIDGVNLAIQIARKKDNIIGVFVKVLPPVNRSYLPDRLKLIISDENNITLQEIIASSRDIALQIKFSGEVGERFNISLALDDRHSIERFVI